MTHLEKLKIVLATVCDLKGAAALLSWDQQTYMPSGSSLARAEQLATLEKFAHAQFTTEEVGEHLEGAIGETKSSAYDSNSASLVRLAHREYDRAQKIPPSLVAEIARQTSLGMEVWVKARKTSNFGLFQSSLQKIIELQRDLANCLGFQNKRYDALLDQYEPGMTTSTLEKLFLDLKSELVPLVDSLSPKISTVDDRVLHQYFPADKQLEFGLEMAKLFGYDLSRGRQDQSVHPFCTSFSINDVRITTRLDEGFLSSALFGTLHECGHALYEQGINIELERTLLGGATSLGIHESQSRLWENLVGRSREFWKFAYPKLKTFFREPLEGCSLEKFYRSINRVEPSLIRVEADEVTYNLHIMLRYELEIDLLEGDLQVKDLPNAWNSKMRSYLGIMPSNDAVGVLQDVHWSHGLIGYFPTYALGNLVSVQFYQQAQKAIPGLIGELEEGKFSKLLDWLRKHVHQHGRKFMPEELVKKETGEPISVGPFIQYLKTKYAEIYF